MNVTLLVVQGKPLGKTLRFTTGEFFFGRGAECHVRADSDWVSRQHCSLRVAADGIFLRDLGSRNGTLVNGELLVQPRQLHMGDHIEIGPLVFEVRWEAAASPQVEQRTAVNANDGTLKAEDISDAAVAAAALDTTPNQACIAQEEAVPAADR